jgi:heme oxygenase
VHGRQSPLLLDVVRERTSALHAEAERSGFVGELLRGRADRRGYAVFLRNLLPAYRELESSLDLHRDSPGIREARRPAVYRSTALESDLEALCGSDWSRAVPLLPAAQRYASAVAEAALGDGTCLIAHAYTRYLGDLNGGRILRDLVARSLSLDGTALAFYSYPQLADVEAFKTSYREDLERAGRAAPDPERVVAEAEKAFHLNIELSREVAGAGR